jgi:peptidoglycan/xylan/chitin deacetylase (PgdA/CDA1 family)
MSIAYWAIGLIIVGSAVYWLWFSPSNQWFGHFFWRASTNEKIVALTFDDGPNPPYTNSLLDILKQHSVPATFFLVGKNLERYPDVGQRIVAEGHAIGNHSYHHAFRHYLLHPTMKAELEYNQNVIHRITGQRPHLFRPPWLFRQPWLLRTAQRLGLTAISGVFGSEREIFQPNGEGMARRALNKVRPGTILIFHDGYNATGGNRAETVRAIDLLIPQVRQRGYRFVTVDEMLTADTQTSAPRVRS